MAQLALLNGNLPETLEFLHLGWWVIHIVGVVVVFYIGFLTGKKKAG